MVHQPQYSSYTWGYNLVEMAAFEIITLSFWSVTYSWFAYVSWRKNLSKISDELYGFPLNDLTVIVPFRNERKNFQLLIDSLNSQRIFPSKFIFVDDHSSDAGDELLEYYLKSAQFNWEILKMAENQFGKKNAILLGVQRATTLYCHTIDADIWLNYYHFEMLPNPKDSEMIILPVRMEGWNFMTFLFELEYASFQILQAMVPRNEPLMASGANLIFKREIYLKFNDLNTHKHRSSGDDQYALAQFIKHKRKINTFFDRRLAVSTDTPESFGALLRQRIRWMGNNTQGNDYRAAYFSGLVFFLNTLFLGLTLYFFAKLNFGFALLLIGLKIFLDFVLYAAWFERNNTWHLAKYLPLLSISYPFYLLILPLAYLIVGRQIVWKNRAVKQ